jgi:CAAX protease family protein
MKRHLAAVLIALALAVAAGLALDDVRLGAALLAALTALFLYLLPFFDFGLTEHPRTPRLAVVVLLLVPYLLYATGTGTFELRGFATLVAYIAVPTLLVFAGRGRPAPGLADFVAVLALWLPFDLGLLRNIWTWPAGQSSYGFPAVVAVDLALLLFIGFRGVPGIGYRFALDGRQAASVAKNFLLFSAIAIPTGIAIGFIAYRPRAFVPLQFLGSLMTIFVFIAVPEELLFRGLIQNFLERWWGNERSWASLVAASVIFGAAHLDNGVAPNVTYAFMATIAGLFYGRAFRQSGNLTAPALVHALVDAVWRQLFHL